MFHYYKNLPVIPQTKNPATWAGLFEPEAFHLICICITSFCEESNIRCTISEDIHQDVWRKFAWNCIFNIVTATTQLKLSKIFDDPEKIQLCKNLFKEIRQVAKSQDVLLGADKEKLIFDIAKDAGDIKPSTLQDRLKGKRMEYDAFTGALIRLADKHKIHIPLNRSLYNQLKKFDNQ